MEGSWQEKYSSEESKRKPFCKELWSPPPFDPVFGETGIGCGERISWEVLSPSDSQTHRQMESEDCWNDIGQKDRGRHLHSSAWHSEDDTDKSWRENRYGYHMDPFEDEKYTRRGCSNNLKFSEDKRGIDEDVGSENEESEGGIAERHEDIEHYDMGMRRDMSEKEVHHVRKVRTFPPLISSFLSNSSSSSFSHPTPMVLLKPLRSKGRLVLQEAKVVVPAMFQPVRRDGRLLLQLPRQDDDQQLAMKGEDKTLDLEKEDAVMEESTFDATSTSENQETLEALSNMRQDAPEAAKSGSIKSYDGYSVLCKHCRRKLHQIDLHSECLKVGFDRQHSGRLCTQNVGESDSEIYPIKNEVRDHPLPANNFGKVAWPKVCGDMIVQDMQAIPLTSSDQVAGQVNLTKSAFEGRCFYPKERSIDWHLAATQATREQGEVTHGPARVLDRRDRRLRNRLICDYLIAWHGRPFSDATWDTAHSLHAQYPSFTIADNVT